MTQELVQAAITLADILQAENAALTALDLPRAASLFAAKTAAVAGFEAARARAANHPITGSAARDTANRLRDAVEQNRRLLERAITVQGRVLATIARAARNQATPPQYGARGRPAYRAPIAAVAFSARA